MAEYLIQDTTLTGIGDAIREKEGSSGAIPVSSLASRIAAISTGTTVQTANGTFKTSSKGTATVTCGFQPDVVSITSGETNDGGGYYVVAIPFLEYSGKGVNVALWTTSSSGTVYDIYASQTTTGFSITDIVIWDKDWDNSTVKRKTFTYTAYKFT